MLTNWTLSKHTYVYKFIVDYIYVDIMKNEEGIVEFCK